MADRSKSQTLDGPTSIPTVTAPAPPSPDVQSRFFGRLSFQNGYPTPETTQAAYGALDYQRTFTGTAFLRLDTDGATVLEAPGGVLGFVDDMWMRRSRMSGLADPTPARVASISSCRRVTTGRCPTPGFHDPDPDSGQRRWLDRHLLWS